MRKKTEPGSMIKKLIFQQANSRCPFCGEDDVTTLEIHHIHPQSEEGTDDPTNLILVCGNCHNKITNGTISEREVFQKKIALLSGKLSDRRSSKDHATNIITLDHSSNTGYIANTLTVKAPKKSVTITPTSGTIAADRDRKNYIQHLIKRYNEFKKVDGTPDFSYAVIYKAIEREFRVKWRDVPIERFEELADYLQNRIDKTRLGRNKKSEHQKTFSTYEEFLESQHLSTREERRIASKDTERGA
ncbi:MAG: HNH endonuclease [Prolixibacteraceae bacterium]|nr:HNH endonuclease [Prolixibacteraceae bacterium]